MCYVSQETLSKVICSVDDNPVRVHVMLADASLLAGWLTLEPRGCHGAMLKRLGGSYAYMHDSFVYQERRRHININLSGQ